MRVSVRTGSRCLTPAMNICHIRLRDMVHEHPAEIAVYAAKHDYPFLVSHVAPMMISMSPIQVIEILPSHLVLPWTKYVYEWSKVLTTATSKYTFTHEYSNCNPANLFLQQSVCLSRLGAGVHTLRSLDAVFAFVGFALLPCCIEDLKQWRENIEAEVAKIPKFSTFL